MNDVYHRPRGKSYSLQFQRTFFPTHLSHLVSRNYNPNMVRLITHNMLSCHVSEYHVASLACRLLPTDPLLTENCNKDNFPLVFKDAEIAIRESEENLAFIRRFLPKLEWNALVTTAQQLGDTSLPEKAPDNEEEVTEDLLKKLHHVLMEVRSKLLRSTTLVADLAYDSSDTR